MKNKKDEKFTIKSRIRSFTYAVNGLKIVFSEEHNARIHLVASILVIIFGFLLNVSSIEWLILFILIALVISTEILNSAIENLCDYVSPEWNQMIKKAKDLSSAAVFLTAIISVICGCIIFIPKIWELSKNIFLR